MRGQIGKWGNSLALRIPAAFAREAQLSDGAVVELSIAEGRLVVSAIRREYSLDELVTGVTDENRHAEINWGVPVGNEAW